MRFQYLALSATALFGAIAIAQDIDNNDTPNECQALCQPVVAITSNCGRNNDGDSPTYLNCVCQFENAGSIIPACEACVANFDRDDGNDNDVNDLIRSCSFTSTTWNSDLATQGPPDATNSLFSTSTPGASPTGNTAQTTGTSQPSGASQGGNAAPSSTAAAAHNHAELTGLAAALLGVLGAL